jgi:RNA polymerase sigma factor (sigma-70 family)
MNSFDNQLIALLPPNHSNLNKAGQFFCQHYERRLKAFLMKWWVAPEDAQEIVGHVFMELVDAIQNNSLEKDCNHYIWKRTYYYKDNKKDKKKKERDKVVYKGEIETSKTFSLHEMPYSETLETPEYLEARDAYLLKYYDTLPPEEQQLWKMLAEKSMSQKEFAESTNKKEGTIRQQWRRLRLKIATDLKSVFRND